MFHTIKTIKNEDVKPGPPKRRGRRPKKIIDQYDLATPVKVSTQNNSNSVILNLPVNIPFNKTLFNKVKPIIDQSNITTDEKTSDLLSDHNDIFNNDIPNDQSCYMCPKLEKRIEILKAKLDKYEKKESFEQSTKIYNNKIKISTTDGKNNTIFKKTNIKCWWDCNNFDTIPCQLPEQYHKNTYYVTGCFCSFNCALAYNLYYLKDSKMYLRKSLVYKMYRELHNLSSSEIFEIKEAPPKEILKDFGGSMSIDTYRKTFNLNKDYILCTSFIKPTNICVEERDSADGEHKNEKKYILKRSKPLQKKTNVMESMVSSM